jgi:putative salt-induced outer membrane protein
VLKKVLLTGLIAINASVHASEIDTEDADTSPPSPRENPVEIDYGSDNSLSLNCSLEPVYTSVENTHTNEVKYYLSKDDCEAETEELTLEKKPSISPIASEIEAEEQDTTPPSPWESQVEFGYQSSKGNDDSQSLNGRLEASYTAGQHRHTGEVKYYLSKDDGETDKDQLSLNLQSDYKISPDYYLYANFKGLETKYSAYFKDYTFSGGLGYQASNTETLVLELELGPGYRYQNPNLDEIDDDDLIFPETVAEAIIRTNMTLSWKPMDVITLASEVTVISGKSNTRVDSEISVTNNITEEIALKVAQSQEYLDRVPPGLSKTDSVFSVNLLFLF